MFELISIIIKEVILCEPIPMEVILCEPISMGTILALSALSTVSGGMQVLGAKKGKEKEIAQRNKEMLQNIALTNKQLRQQDEQFRKSLELKRKESAMRAPTSVLETLSGISAMKRQPAGTADILKSLIS